MEEFHKVRRLPPYVFEQVNRLKASARAAGADIIDLGMGNPDLPTPQSIVDKLCEVVQDPRTHRYSSSKGIPGLRRAQAAYYARPSASSSIRDAGRRDPRLQGRLRQHGAGHHRTRRRGPLPESDLSDPRLRFLMAGGVIRSISVEPDESFFPPLERAVRHSIPKPLALILNYPSNPTAQVATLDFYKDVIAFAKKHDIIVLSDLAYSEIYFDDAPPPSVLEVPGATDVTVEFTSMSKTFSMPGWRMGFAVGNERLIAALTRVKSYLDYGAFTPIQVAATQALNGDGNDIAEVRAIYKRRRDVMVESFGKAGFEVPPPPATMFAWAKIPEKFRHLGSLEFSKLLVEKADVAVAPGIGFGEQGDDYVRLALVENEHRIRQAARNIKRFLSSADETMHNVISLNAHR